MSDPVTKVNPVIVYVDDEPRNLSLFEMSVPEDWTVKCYDSAVEALKGIKKLAPAIIVSDQRMPTMTGLEFLEVAAELVPDAVRFVVTGQTDEATIVELVRRAKIFDYITKPWNTDDLIARLRKAIDYSGAIRERERLLLELGTKNAELTQKNHSLLQLTAELQAKTEKERQLREQLAGLTHWQLAEALERGPIVFPFRRDIACITFDIIGSSQLADKYVDGRPVRSHVMSIFKELILQHGGLIESQGGDACYAHFGAFDDLLQSCGAALHAAREFRVKLRSFGSRHSVAVECGIALHFAQNTVVDQDVIKINLTSGVSRAKKDIHTQSREVDALHRIEKLVHRLPGTNIVMTDQFAARLPDQDPKIVALGAVALSGQEQTYELLLLKSDLVTSQEFERFKQALKDDTELARSSKNAA